MEEYHKNDAMEDLLPLVATLAKEYSSGESTSITYEKAQSLMTAVQYCLNEYEDADGSVPECAGKSVRERYQTGAQLVVEKAKSVRLLLNELSVSFEDYGSQCLYDTVQKGIPEFLRWYDAKYCPQNTIITLDYPVLSDVCSKSGVDAVYDFLQAVAVEQKFLQRFEPSYVAAVLKTYDPNYKLAVENICSIVLMNVIGHAAIRKPLGNTGITEEEYGRLTALFAQKTKEEIADFLELLLVRMVEELYECDTRMLAYFRCEIPNIAVRIEHAASCGCLSRLFVI